MIQIGDFVHRLGDRQAKNPLLRSELCGCDGNGLVAVGLAVDSGRDQGLRTTFSWVFWGFHGKYKKII